MIDNSQKLKNNTMLQLFGIYLVGYFETKDLFMLTVVDLVLIMSVNPGFGGQSFIESQVKKISDLRRLCVEKVWFSNHINLMLGCFFCMSYMNSKAIDIFLVNLFLQGVNPWIEVDGGVSPKNAYKVSNLDSFSPHPHFDLW